MDTLILIWAAGFFVMIFWCAKHQRGGRFGPTTHFPHPCHCIAALYVAAPVLWMALDLYSKEAGPALAIGAFGLWHVVRAVRLLVAWLRSQPITMY